MNQTEAKSLSLVGRLQAKFWIFLLHFVYRLFHVVVKGLGINRVIQLFEINLFTPPGGVLGISSDGDDGRIFLGLKFSIPGFFWVQKFGKYFFG